MSNLDRFKTAQDSSDSGFASALHEIQSGGKRGHWIWYVFPQLSGLGGSPFSKRYAIQGAEEAFEYLRDPTLRSRMAAIVTAVAEQLRTDRPKSLSALMGSDVDARKLVSSLTLFGTIAKKLGLDEGLDDCRVIARAAEEVLAVAAPQDYPPCAYTLDRLRGLV